MVTTLIGSDTNDTRLLKKIILDHGAEDFVLLDAEVHQHIFAKTRRVVISHRLGVAEAFEDRVTGEDLLADVGLTFGLVLSRQLSEELHANLGRFSLTRTRLTRNDNTLTAALISQ